MRLLTCNSNNEVVLTGPYHNGAIPPYAILSHTWGADDDEVTFADLKAGQGTDKIGYAKISFCNEQTQKDNIKYFWIDTCCINKDSSAELAEAINSMYKWYQNARKCYVYLSDVAPDQGDSVGSEFSMYESSFCKSRWFTRGWTLQELLAPREVEFFSYDKKSLGTKQTLADRICKITKLTVAALSSTDLSYFPISQRWLWAQERQTSKVEDKAYCLFGIFNVFLPLIYGEGDNALFRLEEEVQKKYGESHYPLMSDGNAISSRPWPHTASAQQTYNGDDHSERAFKRRKTDQNGVADTGKRCEVDQAASNDSHGHSLVVKHSQQYDNDKYVKLLKSLPFKGIDLRVNSVKRAMVSTCKWLLDHKIFKKWYYNNSVDEHSKFLWIKGKPGCGKSTLMKVALEWARKDKSRTHVPRFIVPYFFNARASTSLEKSALGLYRTIVYRLLSEYSILRPIFMNMFSLKDVESSGEGWTVEELQDFLCESVGSQETFELCLFIDALDEAEYNGDARQMITFLIDLTERSFAAGRTCQLQICLSSRHYPYISIGRGLSLIVEEQPGHGRDIQAYIEKHLMTERSEKESLRTRILYKAARVFLWVVLVVQILNKLHDQGAPSSDIEANLDSLPTDLSELFRDILRRSSDGIESTVLFFQWLLFSIRPLQPAELLVALEYSRSPAESDWQLRPMILPSALDGLARRVLDHSRGLVELVEVGSGQPPVIQFIHETVREFLIKDNGLMLVDPALATNLVGISHEILRTACSRCIACHEIPDEYKRYCDATHGNNTSQKDFESSMRLRFPFLDYAILNLFKHAEQAQQHGICQRTFLERQMKHQGEWIDRFRLWWNVLERYKSRKVQSYKLLIDILAKQQRFSLVRALINLSDTLGLSPMQGDILELASARGQTEIVQLLLKATVDIVTKQAKLDRAISVASENGHDEVLRILLEIVFRTEATVQQITLHQALYEASKKGHEKVVQILLDGGIDINAQGGFFGNALQAAFASSHEKIVQVLLDRGADVNAQGGQYGNALQAALAHGHEKIVQVLLDKGADVNAQGGHFGNALQAASAHGHEKIVQVLLNKGADVNAQGGHFGNALQAALVYGHEKIVQVLLDRGADVNAQGGHCDNILQAASAHGHEKIVQVLLDKGVDVNAQGGHFGNALRAASARGHEKIVQVLLDKGADVNAQGGHFGNALQAALVYGHEKIVQVLLDKGADVNAQGGLFDNALQAVSAHGHEKIVQVLLDRGADVNAQGGHFGNALQAASACGHEEVVQVLLDKGADVNAQGGRYGNALQAASDRGHEKIVQILLDKGADVNAQGGLHGNALQAARKNGYKKVAQMLLDKGAVE